MRLSRFSGTRPQYSPQAASGTGLLEIADSSFISLKHRAELALRITDWTDRNGHDVEHVLRDSTLSVVHGFPLSCRAQAYTRR